MCNHENDAIPERTWARNLDPIAKAGYTDGAADGQTAEYQSSFDMGFEQGLSFGFKLGRNYAVDSVKKAEDDAHSIHRDELRNVNCEICRNNVTLQQNVFNLFNFQEEKNQEYLSVNCNKI